MEERDTCTVLPAKSDSDVMFCLQRYQGLIIDSSLVYTSDLSIRVSSSGVHKFMFYLSIANKILRHCHSWLARQYLSINRFPASSALSSAYVPGSIILQTIWTQIRLLPEEQSDQGSYCFLPFKILPEVHLNICGGRKTQTFTGQK